MAVKKLSQPAEKAILNRRARYDYTLGDELVAGIALTGPETRAAREGHVQLRGAFVTIKNNELWLNNASFSIMLNQKNVPGARSIDDSVRKLLVSKKQFGQLESGKKDGMTIVPLKILTKGRFIKVVIALGKGKKNYDKRETIKRRQQDRDAHRAINS